MGASEMQVTVCKVRAGVDVLRWDREVHGDEQKGKIMGLVD